MSPLWESGVLPLNDTRATKSVAIVPCGAPASSRYPVDDADGAVGLQDDILGMFDVRYASGTECRHEFMVRDALPVHHFFLDRPIAHQEERVSNKHPMDDSGMSGEEEHPPVDGDEGPGQKEAAPQAIVPAVHGVLHGVTEDEEQDKIKGRKQPCLPPASDADENEQKAIDDDASQQQLPPRQNGDE